MHQCSNLVRKQLQNGVRIIDTLRDLTNSGLFDAKINESILEIEAYKSSI